MQYRCAVQGYRCRRDTNAYYAAMYLRTSNDDIYRRTANCFCKDGIEMQTFQDALKQCAKRKDKDLRKLMRYAQMFRVGKLLRQYLEVLL